MSSGHLDLVALVPGKDEEQTIEALLSERASSLAIRKITYRVLVHPRRDPGCRLEAEALLQPLERIAAYALVLFDHEGSGAEAARAEEIEAEVESRLASSGWRNRSRVVVVKPELEAWVWSGSVEVDHVLGWGGHEPSLRDWLIQNNWTSPERQKPVRPKEALEAALRETSRLRSSSVYRHLAERVSLRRCVDTAFIRLVQTLQNWFGN